MTNTSAYSLFIEWEPPNTPNGIIVNYTIYLDYNNGTTDIRITDSNTTEYLLEGLSPHQLVGVEMTANTSIGEGPRSAIQEIRTHQAGKGLSKLQVAIGSMNQLTQFGKVKKSSGARITASCMHNISTMPSPAMNGRQYN